MWIEPKIDWTANDYYNAEDLNRVESNTKYIADYLTGLSYKIPELEVKTDRDITSIDSVSSINRIEENIEAIEDNFITPPGYQNSKNWALGMSYDYRDANRLENNLKLLYEWALIAKENLVYCGTFACGEEGVIY